MFSRQEWITLCSSVVTCALLWFQPTSKACTRVWISTEEQVRSAPSFWECTLPSFFLKFTHIVWVEDWNEALCPFILGPLAAFLTCLWKEWWLCRKNKPESHIVCGLFLCQAQYLSRLCLFHCWPLCLSVYLIFWGKLAADCFSSLHTFWHFIWQHQIPFMLTDKLSTYSWSFCATKAHFTLV